MEIEEIVSICSAYEMGYGASKLGLPTSYNEFIMESDKYYSWLLGYNIGAQAKLMKHEGVLN